MNIAAPSIDQTVAGYVWGDRIRIGPHNQADICTGVKAEWCEALFAEDDQPEQQGKLIISGATHRQTIRLSLPVFGNDDEEGGITLFSLTFYPEFFHLFASYPDALTQESDMWHFTYTNHTIAALEQLRSDSDTATLLTAVQGLQAAMAILHTALANKIIPVTEQEVPACRFLAYDSEREKILDACELIQKSEGKPYTIRDLSRKVAMNECYLKKGFKALTGKTIHEYQQDIRIARAKEMLKTQGVTVTDVALTLGYSSISHFSTAFKRVTGLKPCELLS